MSEFIQTELTYLTRQAVKPVIRVADYGLPSIFEADYETRKILVGNARQLAVLPHLDHQGFQLVHHASQVTDFQDDVQIGNLYYPEMEQLLKMQTGAQSVLIFDHTVRLEREEDGSRSPVRHVHNDYTARSAAKRLTDLLGEEEALVKKQNRVVQLNVWRSINGPVESLPLAMMDGGTLSEGDLVATDLLYPDRTGEIYETVHSAEQRLYFYPRMTPDEVLLFKGYDSDLDAAVRFTPHSAFELPGSKKIDAKPRQSIELRAFAFFED